MAGKIKPKTSFAISFFNRMNNSFASGPQNYHRAFRAQVGSGRSFVGPWDYTGTFGSGYKKRPSGPQESVGAGTNKTQRGFSSPQNTIGAGSRTPARGFISPVAGYGGKVKYKTRRYGVNRTQALSEE